MSEKNERIINLAIALIAAKRPISKDQIFRTIEGYSGNQEAKDRMFERDKETLKSIGIEISIASLDPLFDDEVGYRITDDNYSIALGELTPKEISLLICAANFWEQTSLNSPTKEVVRRLNSLGVSAEFENLPTKIAPSALSQLMDAINSNRCVTFTYLDENLNSKLRQVAPYAITSNQGLWYLHGRDLINDAIKTFRVDRFDSEVSEIEKSIDKPKGFQIPKMMEDTVTKLRIRRDSAHRIRMKAANLVEDGEWEIVSVTFPSQDIAIREILWHGDDIEILEPENIRLKVIQQLDDLIKQYV